MKKISLFLALVLAAVSLSCPVAAAPPPGSDDHSTISPYWTNVASTSYGVTITSAGLSTSTGSVTTYSSTDRITITLTLQQRSGTSYKNYQSWTASGTGSASLSKNLYVEKGTYRVNLYATVYNSSGVYQETIDLYSSTKTYS